MQLSCCACQESNSRGRSGHPSPTMPAQKPLRQNYLRKGIEPMSATHEIADLTALLAVNADIQY